MEGDIFFQEQQEYQEQAVGWYSVKTPNEGWGEITHKKNQS